MRSDAQYADDQHDTDGHDESREYAREAIHRVVCRTGGPGALSPALDRFSGRNGVLSPEMRNALGGVPPASSSVPSGDRPGSKTSFLSPVRPLSMSPFSMAVVGLSDAGGGFMGLVVWVGGRSR